MAVALSAGFAVARLTGVLSSSGGLVAIAGAAGLLAVCAVVGYLSCRTRAHLVLLGSSGLIAVLWALWAVQGFDLDFGPFFLILAGLGFFVAAVLLSWGIALEAIPLLDRGSRRRGLIDALLSVVLIAAAGWNLLLLVEDRELPLGERLGVVVFVILLLCPTALAAAGLANDPANQRLKRLTVGSALGVITCAASIAGPALDQSNAVSEAGCFASYVVIAAALITRESGSRPAIELLTRLRRRRRVVLVLFAVYVSTLIVAMASGALDELTGGLIVLVLLVSVATQDATVGENFDLSRRLRGQIDELTSSEERFRSAFEAGQMGLVVADSSGVITSTNDAMATMLGCTRDWLVGRNVAEITLSLDHDVNKALLDETRSGMRSGYVIDQQYRHSGGSAVWASVSVSVARSSDGSESVIAQVLDVTSDRLLREQLSEFATRDSLTGLLNRRSFVDLLDVELGRNATSAVLFIDLDRFKEINDTLGHGAGDDMLVELGARIQRTAGGSTFAARFGGDEFVVAVRDAAEEGAVVALGNRILKVLAEPVVLGGTATFVSGSIGIARSDTSSTSAQMLSDADAAMYVAKAGGRNRVALFDSQLREKATERLQTTNELHRAVESGELLAFFQPIIRLADDAVAGFEALVRWRHPVRGLLAPGAFLDIADDTGLIVPMGLAVLRASCEQLGAWIRSGAVAADSTMSVNLAPRQLADPFLVDNVKDAIAGSGIEPGSLVLEITESSLMSEGTHIDIAVSALRELGVQFAVDDFGTGYSSLTYLKRFPVQVLKVDREFVDGLPTESGDVVIVNAVVGLANALGLRCVAEGVEEPAQAEYLRKIGCSHAQGYMYARPMTPQDTDSWLADRRIDSGRGSLI
jgi:diguanylate cyclase (GGDEF)-like protein/PAS domain S-box-containing protein